MGGHHGMCSATSGSARVRVGARVGQLRRGEAGSREQAMCPGGVQLPRALDGERVGLTRRNGAVPAHFLDSFRVRFGR